MRSNSLSFGLRRRRRHRLLLLLNIPPLRIIKDQNIPTTRHIRLVNRAHIRPIIRQPPRMLLPVVPILNDERAPLEVLPLHVLRRRGQLGLRPARRTAASGEVRALFDEVLDGVDVAFGGCDVEGGGVGEEAVGAEVQLPGFLGEVGQDG